MHTLYYLAAGPFAIAAFVLLAGGSLFRLVRMGLLARKKDPAVFDYMSARYGFRSLFHWLVPFGSRGMRLHPALTIASFLFHVCAIVAPVFLYAHVLLIDESWNIAWVHIPDGAADAMSLVVIAACVFFLVRRMKSPEVSYLSTWRDYAVLALVAAPFVTGLWSFHQFPGFRYAGIIHMLSGELLLASIPFTRLSHMIFFPITRAYMGSEFGAVRNARDW